MLGYNVCPIVFNILGPRPSIPIVLIGSEAEIIRTKPTLKSFKTSLKVQFQT